MQNGIVHSVGQKPKKQINPAHSPKKELTQSHYYAWHTIYRAPT